jgi:signal transduction histidine kinase
VNPLGSSLYLTYVGVFALATLGCLVGFLRARSITDRDTRYGLLGVLAGSGGWALFELAFLLAPTRTLKYAAYNLSLVVGLTTVGAWLYFCSAYTGRSLHQNENARYAAVGLYLAITSIKLTNPLHGQYFSLVPRSEPFTHIAIQHGELHWVVAGLSYALVAVGFFMLFELFSQADYDTRPLAVLVGITGLPVVFDIVGFASPLLLDINYEPLGVAAFALGVLYIYDEEFLAVQLSPNVDGPVVYLDANDRVRSVNRRAEAVFDGLADAHGQRLENALPSVVQALNDDHPVLEHRNGGEPSYFLVSDTAFELGQSDIGRMVVLTDVTETERNRRELERQNESLEGFAAAIRHELLNTLQIVRGRVGVAGTALERGDVSAARDSLEQANETSERMTSVVEDLSVLARHSQSVEQTDSLAFDELVRDAWADTPVGELTLDAEDSEGTIVAEATRLRELLSNAFEFAVENDASSVRVELGTDCFTITGDGHPPDTEDTDKFFEYGSAAPHTKAGLLLPNVRMLATVQGWSVSVADYDDGIRLVVSDVDVVDSDETTNTDDGTGSGAKPA